MAENETTETTEEVTQAVESQSPATEKGIEEAATKEAKTEEAKTEEVKAEETPAEPAVEEISYHAVEKEGEITAIWEMQGRKHIRTISARSDEGEKILSLFTSEIHETEPPVMSEKSA